MTATVYWGSELSKKEVSGEIQAKTSLKIRIKFGGHLWGRKTELLSCPVFGAFS
jgi:hypothetical protein